MEAANAEGGQNLDDYGEEKQQMPQPFSVRGEQEEQASDDNDDDESQKPVQTEPPVLAQDERSES